MFIDELFEKYLIEDRLSYEDAIRKVCVEKLDKNDTYIFESVKRIDNAYKLFSKRHPEIMPDAFRIYVKHRSPNLYKALGWDK